VSCGCKRAFGGGGGEGVHLSEGGGVRVLCGAGGGVRVVLQRPLANTIWMLNKGKRSVARQTQQAGVYTQ
jgi:hypothetical protein